ncbi:MAG TPA: SMC-Scp complex subunit ScpB [Steroidobacteraceae bacterium]|nr:SMC-Scp complex subunit ScpB [Steroidobacteraceae bacterium]
MNEHDLKHIIEATLLAAGRPVPTQQLLDLFDERERPTSEQFQAAVALLQADYADRGIELAEVASGWRIQVRPRTAEVVSRLWQERPSRYSRALLETLALIAYRQPITRSEIEEIRGVSISSTIMRTLQERNWIRTVGHREVPGRPELLGTTREFLDYFGLKSLDQLPTLAELKDVETIGVQLELPAAEPPPAVAAAEDADPADARANADESTESNVEAEASAVESTEAEASGESVEAESDSDADSSAASDNGENNGDDAELMADADDSESDEDGDESHTLVASSEEESDSHEIREPRED